MLLRQQAGIAPSALWACHFFSQAIESFDDITLRNLACNLLDGEARAGLYGRSTLFGRLGNTPDVCATTTVPPTASVSDVSPGIVPLLRQGGARFRTETLPDVIRHAPKLPMRLLVTWPARFDGEFDRNRGGYPLAPRYFVGTGTRIFGSPVDFVSPRVLPMTLAEATAFESRNPPATRAAMTLGLELTIVGAKALSMGGERDKTALPDGQIWQFEAGPISLYKDSSLTEVLYTLEQTAAPVVNQNQVSPTPRDSAANGANAARVWKLPLLGGVPTVEAGDHKPSLEDFNAPANGMQGSSVAWTRAMRALGLSLEPERAAALSDRELLRYARLFLSPSRLAEVGPQQRCDSDLTMPGCDFVLSDAATLFRKQDLPAIIKTAPSLPMKLILTIPMRIAAWDAQRGGFPLASVFSPSSQIPYQQIFGSLLDAPLPDFLPATEAQARQLVARTAATGSNGLLHLGLPLTLTGMHAFPGAGGVGFDAQTGLSPGSDWVFEPATPTLYADPGLTQAVHEFGPLRHLPAALTTQAAARPRLLGPLIINDDSALLIALRSGKVEPARVDWKVAAQSRFQHEAYFRNSLDYMTLDPWGVFFDRARSRPAAPLSADEIEAYRGWSERRAAMLPREVLFRQSVWPASGPQRLAMFDPTASAMMHTAWPFPGGRDSLRGYEKVLQSKGLATDQMLPVSLVIPGINLNVLFAAPRPATTFIVELPQGISPLRAGSPAGTRQGDAAAVVEVSVEMGEAELIRSDYSRDRDTALLVRVTPTSAVVSPISGIGMTAVPLRGEAPIKSISFVP